MTIEEIIRSNRSIRRFKDGRLTHEDLVAALEAARTSTCSMNRQSLKYVVLESPQEVAMMQPLCRWAALLKGAGDPKPNELPKAFVIITTPANPAHFADIDIGIALTAIRLVALSRGIASCVIGSHDPAKVQDVFGLPHDRIARLVIALGYPAMKSMIEDAKDGNTAYFLDAEKNCHVPKLPFDEVVSFR